VRISFLIVIRERSLGLEIIAPLINSVMQLYVRASSRMSASVVVEGMFGTRRSKKRSNGLDWLMICWISSLESWSENSPSPCARLASTFDETAAY
jgi:hypothetical protein